MTANRSVRIGRLLCGGGWAAVLMFGAVWVADPALADVVIVESRLPDGNVTPNPPYLEIVGNWFNSSAKSTASGLTGNGSRFTPITSTPGADQEFKLTPTLGMAGGVYLLEVTMTSSSSNISPDIDIGITQVNCTGLPANTDRFQRAFANSQWHTIGTLTLDGGQTTPEITFRWIGGTLAASGGRWYADGFRFTLTTDPCTTVPEVDPVPGPLGANQNTVLVTGVDPTAEAVTVYRTNPTPMSLGQATGTPPLGTDDGGGGRNVTVTLTTAMAAGDRVVATQTISTQEGCVPLGGSFVGSGVNSGLLLTLGIRETGPATGPCTIASDGGIVGAIEWIGADTTNGGAPQGKLIQPDIDWQTVTFDPVNDLKLGFAAGGNGTIDGECGTLEHLAVAADPESLDAGPYVMYIDNITNGPEGSEVLVADFELPTTPGTGQEVFRQPSFSGSTSQHLLLPTPNQSFVTDSFGDASAQSDRIWWQFIDDGATRWVRLTTNGTPNVPNPIIDLTQPVTLRILLLPADVVAPCNDPVFDADGDGDVDHDDWGVVQACVTGTGDPDMVFDANTCGCFDINGDDAIDGTDIGSQSSPTPNTFEGCASGPTVPADAGCDD